MNKNLLLHAFAMYVGTGPLYWVPGVPVEVVTLIKTALLLIILVAALANAGFKGRVTFPGGRRMVAIWLTMLVLTLPGALFGMPVDGAYRVTNILLIGSFLFAAKYFILTFGISKLIQSINKYFLCTCLLTITIWMLNSEAINPFDITKTIESTGLGTKRTGWSIAMALYLPWLLVNYGSKFSLLVVAAGIGNQLMVVGRSGIFTSVLVFVLRAFYSRKASYIAVSFGLLIGFLYSILLFPEYFRIQSIYDAAGYTFSDLDVASAGRLGQISWGLGLILQRPIWGHGFGRVIYDDFSPLIHNEFVRIAAEGGIPLALVSGLFIVTALTQVVRRNTPRPGTHNEAAKLCVIAAGVASQFEPMLFYGAFSNSVIVWFGIACCLSAGHRARVNAEKTGLEL